MSSVVSNDKTATLSDGTNINYVTSGTGSHVTLLMPGALGTARTDFTPQLEGLNSEGHLSLVAWDPPGYGKSRPPSRTFPLNFFERDANVAVEFMKTIGHDKFSVLGWSDGGITGLILAAKYPEHVRKLVAFAANAYFTDQDLDMILKVKDVSKWSERMRAPMEEIYGKDHFPVLWSQWCESVEKIIESSPDKDICKNLVPNIKCPTLIVHGDKDAMVAAEHPEYLQKRIPEARMQRFPDGKHNLHFKYKEEFNKLVECFLNEDL